MGKLGRHVTATTEESGGFYFYYQQKVGDRDSLVKSPRFETREKADAVAHFLCTSDEEVGGGTLLDWNSTT